AGAPPGEVGAVIVGGRLCRATAIDDRVMRQTHSGGDAKVVVLDRPALCETSLRHALLSVLPAARRASRSRCMTGMCLSMFRKKMMRPCATAITIGSPRYRKISMPTADSGCDCAPGW